jgi:putative transposase
MPTRKSKRAAAVDITPVSVKPEILDQLIPDPMSAGDFESMFRGLKKALLVRALGAELTHDLGYKPGEDQPDGQDNQRNWTMVSVGTKVPVTYPFRGKGEDDTKV